MGKSPFLSGLLAALAALVLLPLAEWAASSVFQGGEVGIWRRILFSVTVVVATVTASSAASGFSSFVAHSMLSGVSPFAVKIIFLFLAAYLAFLGRDAVKKFSLVAFLMIVTVAAVLFVLSAESFDVARIKELFSEDLSFSGVAKELVGMFVPSTLAVIYLSLGRAEKRTGGALLAVVLSSALLILCRLNVSLLLGDSLAAAVEYPYSEAVSTVTAGKLFARLEGWAYLMYYAAEAVRASVCLSLSCRLFCEIFPSAGKKRLVQNLMPFTLGALSLIDVTNLSPFS